MTNTKWLTAPEYLAHLKETLEAGRNKVQHLTNEDPVHSTRLIKLLPT